MLHTFTFEKCQECAGPKVAGTRYHALTHDDCNLANFKSVTLRLVSTKIKRHHETIAIRIARTTTTEEISIKSTFSSNTHQSRA